MGQHGNGTGAVLVLYRNSIETVLKQYWSSTGAVLEQYWNSIGTILKQYWSNSLPENLSRISEKDPCGQPTKKEPYTCASTCANAFQVGGLKSQNVGCGTQLFLWTCAFSRLCHQPPIQGKGPCNRSFCSTLILKAWMSIGTALKL